MAETIIHLVRHGEVYNPQGILYGRLPGYRLSARGESMAARTAEFFRDRPIAYLGASPLLRAQQTAQYIGKVTDCTPDGIDVVPEIIEAGNSFAGLHIKGWDSALWNPRYWWRLRNPRVPTWGEPYTEIKERMFAALRDTLAIAPGQEAVLVSHELPIVCVQRAVSDLPLAHNPLQRKCALASVSSLHFNAAGEFVRWEYADPAAEI